VGGTPAGEVNELAGRVLASSGVLSPERLVARPKMLVACPGWCCNGSGVVLSYDGSCYHMTGLSGSM